MAHDFTRAVFYSAISFQHSFGHSMLRLIMVHLSVEHSVWDLDVLWSRRCIFLSSSLGLGIDAFREGIECLFLDQGSESWNWCFGLRTPRLLVIMLWTAGGFVNAFGLSSGVGRCLLPGVAQNCVWALFCLAIFLLHSYNAAVWWSVRAICAWSFPFGIWTYAVLNDDTEHQ